MKPTAHATAITPKERYLERWILFLLLAIGVLVGARVSAEPPANGATTLSSEQSTEDPEQLIATFAGGCFWCTEAVFERMEGVSDVISGYIGGHVPNPTYEQVCSKTTGHAEAIEMRYDPSKVKYEELLEVFFKTHDPTTLNQQGADKGPQYRSSVFYHDEKQREAAEKYIKKLDASGEFDRKIVTKLEKATTFYPAEEYHQDFFRKNPNYGYCRAVVVDKVRKFNRNFGDKIKEELK
ncbi:peptide-methionine (S)-S-oxide reductase MsrA [Roseiconus lacunae]|uniref:Peptide methionine sulfoxide reductase MsrA n=1 Tax=Roseiconus lacunae TaxID=2605694 RepID=A0ABT7PLH6_9BACT|nr:peptide-methionine (S)-S-oxide reductase MsrA [Roseiconus lacunae]MDM4017357.1 peptide-methionine (S)-S-oxide reductase MsrA [Roseiconus lacunae]